MSIDCHEADAALKGILVRGSDLLAEFQATPAAEGVEAQVLNLLKRIKVASESITGGGRDGYEALEWRGRACLAFMVDTLGCERYGDDDGFLLRLTDRAVWFSDRGTEWSWELLSTDEAMAAPLPRG